MIERLKNIKSFFGRNYHNSLGWKTNKKIIVIESDDWGSIRMPSKEVYKKLLFEGIRVDKDIFTKYDSLASSDDLSRLFEVLHRHRDKFNKPAVITANTIVANPDFKSIKDVNFSKYIFERFTDTLKKYPNHSNSLDLWKEGMSNQIFHPQLHGREHVNVALWLQHLSKSNKETRMAFEHNMFGLSSHLNHEKDKSYMAAYDFEDELDLPFIKRSIVEAQEIFDETFGYKSKSFIAPNYIWNTTMEDVLNKIGVEYIQSSRYQLLPRFNKEKGSKNSKHYIGEKNKNNQIYLVRNCIFEPSMARPLNAVDNTLKQIETSFFWKKPAILSSHRVNYIGCIDENNSAKNLKYLDNLLKKILKTWPDVEFMTSDKLGDTIKEMK